MLPTPGAVGLRCVGAQYRPVRFASTAFFQHFLSANEEKGQQENNFLIIEFEFRISEV